MLPSSNNLSCIIIDDEPLQHKVLEGYISMMPQLKLEASFTDPLEAIKFVQLHHVDMIFLDIQMPELNGFQVMDILGPGVSIIITSAYRDFALAGFDYDVDDYLLKPISFDRFCKAVNKLLNGRSSMQENQLQERYLFIKSGFKLVKIDLRELFYIEAVKDYIYFISPSGKVMSLLSLSAMEARLDKAGFARIHKSFIVAIDKITQIEKQSVWIEETELPIGNMYREAFLEKISKLG